MSGQRDERWLLHGGRELATEGASRLIVAHGANGRRARGEVVDALGDRPRGGVWIARDGDAELRRDLRSGDRRSKEDSETDRERGAHGRLVPVVSVRELFVVVVLIGLRDARRGLEDRVGVRRA